MLESVFNQEIGNGICLVAVTESPVEKTGRCLCKEGKLQPVEIDASVMALCARFRAKDSAAGFSEVLGQNLDY